MQRLFPLQNTLLQGKTILITGAKDGIVQETARQPAALSGKYFSQKRIAKPSEAAPDRELQQAFWERSAEMVNLTI